MTRPEAAPFPGREELLRTVQGVLSRYVGTAVTVRQLYYRLVAAHAIPNNLRSYKNLVGALTGWRRAGKIPLGSFIDRTRGMDRLDSVRGQVRFGRQIVAYRQVGERTDDPRRWAEEIVSGAVQLARDYELPRWFGQEYRVVVAVEKQALEGPFAGVCEELDTDLAVCRGYPSLSFLHEIARSLRASDTDRAGRRNVILYFGDFDPSGLNIPETVERDLAGFFGQSFKFARVALTREQINERDLQPAPVKLADSRAKGFVAEHGEEVYELDAIEPRELQALIREAVSEYWDAEPAEEREKLVARGRKKVAKTLEEAGISALLDRLGKEDSEGASP